VKNDTILKCKGTSHNHDRKLAENVQNIFTGLKCRILDDIDKPIGKIYEEEVKRFVSICYFSLCTKELISNDIILT